MQSDTDSLDSYPQVKKDRIRAHFILLLLGRIWIRIFWMIGSGFLGFEFYWKVRFLEGFDSDPIFFSLHPVP